MADTFWEALSNTVHRAVNLRVVTMLGDPVIGGTLEELQVSAPAGTCPSMVTDINLIGGDVTYIISEQLHAAEYADLRQGHAAAVTQANAIVERNVNMLVTLFKALGAEVSNLDAKAPPGSGPVRTAPGGNVSGSTPS
jgi:hypothetical protein